MGTHLTEHPITRNQDKFHTNPVEEKRVFKTEADKEHEARRLQHIRQTREEVINSETFAKMSVGAHVRWVVGS